MNAPQRRLREAPFTLDTQRRFLDDLLGRRPRTAAQRRADFRMPRGSSVEDRWHVYGHGFTARIVEALGSEYAAVRRILGEAAFVRLTERYLEIFPPRSFDLGHAGDRLARFLEYDALTQELPFLPDLARLERKIAEAFVAADAQALTWDELQARPAEEAASLPLGIAPGVAVVRSDWPVHALWRCRLEDDDAAVDVPVEGRPQTVLVYRLDSSVRCEAIGEEVAQLVEAAQIGHTSLEDLRALVSPDADAAALGRMLETFRELVRKPVFVIRRRTGFTGAIEIEGEIS